MTAPLPVMETAYDRFIRPADEGYGVVHDDEREQASEYAAAAELMALQGAKYFTTSGTSLSADAIATSVEPAWQHLAQVTNAIAKYSESDCQTNEIVYDLLRQNLKKFYEIVDRGDARCRVLRPSANTTWSLIGSCSFTSHGTDSATDRQPVEDRFPWLRAVYELVKNGQTQKALRTIYASVEDHFSRGDLIGLGEVLSAADVARLNPQTATALLRITGRAKTAIPSWKVLLQRTQAELARQNLRNIQALLVGLGT